eukprot:2113292-Pyramimonas_sp.AAC.2
MTILWSYQRRWRGGAPIVGVGVCKLQDHLQRPRQLVRGQRVARPLVRHGGQRHQVGCLSALALIGGALLRQLLSLGGGSGAFRRRREGGNHGTAGVGKRDEQHLRARVRAWGIQCKRISRVKYVLQESTGSLYLPMTLLLTYGSAY